MLLFMAVQYNDPDGLMWVAIYSVPAAWCAVAAWRVQWLSRADVYTALLCSMAAALALMIHFWPTTDRFWVKSVWWETETAREGMGIMIAMVMLSLVWLLALRKRAGQARHPAMPAQSH